MSAYRHPKRAVRREMRRIRRDGPRYGSQRGQRDQADARADRDRRNRHLATIITLVAVAIAAIGWDYADRHHAIDLNRPSAPAQGHSVDVTTTLKPNGDHR